MQLTTLTGHAEIFNRGCDWGGGMSFRSIGLVASIVLAVGGCAFVDPVDSRYDTIGRSLAKARNEAIFLNLVRASHNYPLDFVTIANVTPSITNTSSLGLPSFLLGPRIPPPATTELFTPGRDVVLGNTTASNTTAVSTNFSVSTQETSSFYEGFLKPVDLQVVNYFIRQNYPRELLFWLFVDSVEVDIPPNRTIGSRYDPPKDYGCNPTTLDPRERCFSDFVAIAIGSGLTVEETAIQKSGGGQAKNDNSNSNNTSKAQTTIYNRLCFNPILARHAQAEMTQSGMPWPDVQRKFLDLKDLKFNPVCGVSPWNPEQDAKRRQPDYFPFQVGGIKFKIVPRSAYGVFEFLGKIMKVQLEQMVPPLDRKVPFIPIGRIESVTGPPKLWTGQEDPYLLTVDRGYGGECFVHTWFKDGDYCVPDNAQTTKTIFSLLAQLIAIQTAATDLSITPLVRIVQ
jgi:hypothetical protein